MTGAPAGVLATHPTFDVVCDVSCILTNAEEGARGKAHFRSCLGLVLTDPDKQRLLYPQQPTFAGRCPLSCRFRPLYP